VTPVEFRGDLWHQKIRVPGVSCGVVCMILCFAVLVEHRLVTYGHRHTHTQTQTDGHRPVASTADDYHRAVKIRLRVMKFWAKVECLVCFETVPAHSFIPLKDGSD